MIANWFVSGRDSSSITAARGVAGSATVKDLHLEANGGHHVEAIYILLDLNNGLELGWDFDRATLFTGPKVVFNTRVYNGAYDRDEMGGAPLGDRRFLMWRDPASSRYRFRMDSTTYSNTRDPPFVGGSPLGFGEINNQCDDGTTRWWNLDRRAQNNTDTRWFDWVNAHYTCDTEKHYGYTVVSSSEFKVTSRIGIDTYADPANCHPLRM